MDLTEFYFLPKEFPSDISNNSMGVVGKFKRFFELLAISNAQEIDAFIANDKVNFNSIPFYIRLTCYRLLLLQSVPSEVFVNRARKDIIKNIPAYNGCDIVKLLKEGDSNVNLFNEFNQIYARNGAYFNEFYKNKLVPFLTKLLVATPKSMIEFLEPMQYDGYEQLIFFIRLLVYRIALLTEPDNERYLALAVNDPCRYSTSIIVEEYEPRLSRIRGNCK